MSPAGPLENDPARERVGSVIRGKWTVDALLGVGGMAAVYSATHRNGQRAALKILHADFARDRGVCERFTREAYVSNRIQHAACVQVADDDVTDEGQPYLVMELLLGKTLREHWRANGPRLPPAQALAFMVPILDCLDACHRVGVIHRDLKPANIFVCESGAIKVLDFGIAQFRSATAERTATGTALGTPSYMAPEQAMGLVDQLDGRADLFSVGAMLHALLTGQRINKARSEGEALILAATKPVPSMAHLAPELPVEIIALVDKALAWDRRNRFETAKDMLAAVREALGLLEGAEKPSRSQPVTRARGGSVEFEPEAGTASAIETADAPAPAARRPSVRTPAPRAHAPASVAPAASVAVDPTRLAELRDVFRRIDRVLPTVRQLGWEHAATTRALRGAFEPLAVLAAEEAVVCTLRPYSLLLGEETLWEPGAPFDAIPYNLFACGLRTLRFERGLTLGELRQVLALFLLEPGRDLPPEDDLATALWELGLLHVRYELADAFVEGDAAAREAFYGEADEVERQAESSAKAQASRLEARAMAVSTDRAALRAEQGRSPMAVDDVARAVLAEQLAVSGEAWTDRYYDVLLEGLVDAGRKRDAPAVLGSLRASAADLVVAGHLSDVARLRHELTERAAARLPEAIVEPLRRALSNALFGGETLALALRRVEAHAHEIADLAPVLDSLSPKDLPAVFEALERALPAGLRDVLVAFVGRHAEGREGLVAELALKVELETGCALVEVLAASPSPAARQALATLAESERVDLRLEARVRLAESPDLALGLLTGALDGGSSTGRVAALSAMARHGMTGGFVAVARAARQKDFAERPLDEQRAVAVALLRLGAERGEAAAVELAQKGGLFGTGKREAARACVIEVLGEYGRSEAAVTALRELSQSRWGTSEETREAAMAAADRIARRAAEGAS